MYIPCYNGARYLADSLQALITQDYQPSEILIIDDGSTDQTAKIAKQFPVHLITHDTNRGLAAARNTAIKNASHEFIASIDADIVADLNWLGQLLAILEDAPGIAGAGGKLKERHREFPADRWRATHLIQDLGEKRLVLRGPMQEGVWLSGFGTIFRKTALERIGGYNEAYRTSYEDADLCGRLLDAGYSLVYEPMAQVTHIRRDTMHSVVRTAWRWQFWIQYHNGGYANIKRKVMRNLDCAKWLFLEDMGNRAYQLLHIDLAYFVLFCYWDLRHSFSSSRK